MNVSGRSGPRARGIMIAMACAIVLLLPAGRPPRQAPGVGSGVGRARAEGLISYERHRQGITVLDPAGLARLDDARHVSA